MLLKICLSQLERLNLMKNKSPGHKEAAFYILNR